MAAVICVSVNFDFFMFLQYLNVNNFVYLSTVGLLGGLTKEFDMTIFAVFHVVTMVSMQRVENASFFTSVKETRLLQFKQMDEHLMTMLLRDCFQVLNSSTDNTNAQQCICNSMAGR